jgi:hypothetical protein
MLLLLFDVTDIHMKSEKVVKIEERTARLTILIDPRKKSVFERLCAEEDLTPSQVVRRLIRGYIEQRLGRPWKPGEEPPPGTGERGAGRGLSRRRAART